MFRKYDKKSVRGKGDQDTKLLENWGIDPMTAGISPK